MGWHYALIKTDAVFLDGPEYHIVEAYPDIEPEVKGKIPYTTGVTFIGESPEEVVQWLVAAIVDIKKHGVINND